MNVGNLERIRLKNEGKYAGRTLDNAEDDAAIMTNEDDDDNMFVVRRRLTLNQPPNFLEEYITAAACIHTCNRKCLWCDPPPASIDGLCQRYLPLWYQSH